MGFKSSQVLFISARDKNHKTRSTHHKLLSHTEGCATLISPKAVSAGCHPDGGRSRCQGPNAESQLRRADPPQHRYSLVPGLKSSRLGGRPQTNPPRPPEGLRLGPGDYRPEVGGSPGAPSPGSPQVPGHGRVLPEEQQDVLGVEEERPAGEAAEQQDQGAPLQDDPHVLLVAAAICLRAQPKHTCQYRRAATPPSTAPHNEADNLILQIPAVLELGCTLKSPRELLF